MHSASLVVVVTSNLYKDSLNSLLFTRFIFGLNVFNANLLNSEAVNPLTGPLYYGPLLHQEFVSLIPIFTLVNIEVHSHSFLLEPETVAACRQGTQ